MTASARPAGIPASQVPRLTPAFLEQQRRDMGESWFQQEYCCAFEAMEGLIYPNFARQVIRGREPEWREVWGPRHPGRRPGFRGQLRRRLGRGRSRGRVVADR